jgi:hypothetical protein
MHKDLSALSSGLMAMASRKSSAALYFMLDFASISYLGTKYSSEISVEFYLKVDLFMNTIVRTANPSQPNLVYSFMPSLLRNFQCDTCIYAKICQLLP